MADVYDLFPHNWAVLPSMETEWSTAIVESSENLVEERRGLLGRPRRTITLRWDGMDQAEAHRLFFLLHRVGHQRLRVPLYQDVVRTTAVSNATTINAVPTDRRFYAGQRVVIHEKANGRPSNVQYRVIASVSGTTIELTAALTGSYPAGSWVLPVMDTEVLLEGDAVAMTDEGLTVLAAFSEVLTTALPASADYDDIAADYDTGDSAEGTTYYILNFGPTWVKEVRMGIVRAGGPHDFARDYSMNLRGPRPQSIFSFSCDETTKADVHRLLKFFDAHRGMLVPFFVRNPLTIWNVENLGTTFVDVTRAGDIDDPTLFASYLYLELTNGTVYVREITAVANNGGLNRLSVTLPGGIVAGDVRFATTAHLCRFRSDSLRETWYTDTVATIQVDLLEVLNEKEVALP